MKFKYFLYLFLSLGVVACCISCDDEESDIENEEYDFSNTLPPYVQLSTDDLGFNKAGDTLSVSVIRRVADQANVTVGYAVTGDASQTGSVSFPNGELTSGAISIPLPAVADTSMATLTITSVSGGYSIGRTGLSNADSPTSASITWEP